MRQSGSRGLLGRDRVDGDGDGGIGYKRDKERQGDHFFPRTLRGVAKKGAREMLPIKVVEGGPDRVGLQALAGRLSRRGGSTPPEGDFGACLPGGRGRGAMWGRWGTVVREEGSRGGVGGVANRVEEPTWSPSRGSPPPPAA